MKKFIMGLVVGICITLPASLYAAENVSKIEAYLNPDVKIEVDGTPVQLDKTPIIYEQTTYVPLREMGEEIMGKSVGWDQETQTVTMNSTIDESEIWPTDDVTPTAPVIEETGGDEVDISEQLRNLEGQKNQLAEMRPIYVNYVNRLKSDMEKNPELDYSAKIAEYEQLIIDNDAEIARFQDEIDALKAQAQPTP